ncbi:hypothetical protein ACIBO6_05690 [Streptomyces luteogriseus]
MDGTVVPSRTVVPLCSAAPGGFVVPLCSAAPGGFVDSVRGGGPFRLR